MRVFNEGVENERIDNPEFWGRQLALEPVNLEDDAACVLALMRLRARGAEITHVLDGVKKIAARVRANFLNNEVCYEA